MRMISGAPHQAFEARTGGFEMLRSTMSGHSVGIFIQLHYCVAAFSVFAQLVQVAAGLVGIYLGRQVQHDRFKVCFFSCQHIELRDYCKLVSLLLNPVFL